jgi:hypothetical protein
VELGTSPSLLRERTGIDLLRRPARRRRGCARTLRARTRTISFTTSAMTLRTSSTNIMRPRWRIRFFRNAPRKRVLRHGLSARPNSARTWSRTTIRLSIPRNTWRNSSIGRAPPSSVETSSSLTANLFPAREVRRGLRHYRHRLRDRNRERCDGRHFLRVRFRRAHPASNTRLGYCPDRRRGSGNLAAECPRAP